MEKPQINSPSLSLHDEVLEGSLRGVILYIPGTSGLSDFERIERISEKSAAAGYDFACLDIWKDSADLETKTLKIVLDGIERAVFDLAAEGKRPIYVVAKSFGAGVVLLRNWPHVSKMVLWAPAISVSEASSYDVQKNLSFAKIESPFKVSTSPVVLGSIDIPILVIRGSQDVIVPQEKLNAVLDHLPKMQFFEIPGMGHSPDSTEQLNDLIDASLSFLQTS